MQQLSNKLSDFGIKPWVIAEVAQSHDGSLGMAHAFIDAVAETGASAIKFQTHIAGAESTPGEPWRVKFSRQDASRYDYWKRMEFTAEQWGGLKAHAEEKGLLFMSSPFSMEAVELLEKMGMEVWKIASGEVSNSVLLRRIAATGKATIISSGLSTYEELGRAVQIFDRSRTRLAVLQCTTEYPCPYEKVGLNVLKELGTRFDCPVGLSDHSGTVFPSLAAAALGGTIFEVHVALSRRMFGPDVKSSLEVPELAQLVQGVNAIHVMRNSNVDKEVLSEDVLRLRSVFGKRILARRALSVGTVLTENDFVFKKSDRGISIEELDDVIGLKVMRTIEENTAICREDLSPRRSS